MSKLTSLCVYCGSRDGAKPAYVEGARGLGRLMAAREITLVYGGGSVGMMGAIADAVLDHGGEAIGIIPYGLNRREMTHQGLTRLEIVDDMHERKALMAEEADAFAALPGGFGTLEELFEALTWGQLGIHKKPCGLLDTAGYWDPLLQMLEHCLEEGFIDQTQRDLVLEADTPEAMLDRILAYDPPEETIWIQKRQQDPVK